jgi:hypothetical protein
MLSRIGTLSMGTRLRGYDIRRVVWQCRRLGFFA